MGAYAARDAFLGRIRNGPQRNPSGHKMLLKLRIIQSSKVDAGFRRVLPKVIFYLIGGWTTSAAYRVLKSCLSCGKYQSFTLRFEKGLNGRRIPGAIATNHTRY